MSSPSLPAELLYKCDVAPQMGELVSRHTGILTREKDLELPSNRAGGKVMGCRQRVCRLTLASARHARAQYHIDIEK